MWELVIPGRSRIANDSAPRMRNQHAMCLHEEDGYMYLYGGRNGSIPLKDFWRYDPLSNEWIQLKRSSSAPPCLQDHTMIAWQNELYIYGGEVGFASNDQTPLWTYNIDSGNWKLYEQDEYSSICPTGRRGHTAVTYYNCMYIYGGYLDLLGSSSELWTYNFELGTWNLLLPRQNKDQVPSKRHNHSAVVHDGAMWIYGGMKDLQNKGDFWKYEFDTGNWFKLRSKTGPGDIHSHSAIRVMSTMFIFGGEREGVLLNELWRYHFGIDVWEKIYVAGICPVPSNRPVLLPNADLDLSPSSTSMFSESQSKWSSQMSCAMKTPTSGPSKSVSMYSSFTSQADEQLPDRIVNKKHFRSRIYPVTKFCGRRTSSDEEEEDALDKDSGYRSTNGSRIIPSSQSQMNLRALRDKMSSSRLVRSISGSNYSILQNKYIGCPQDENQIPVESANKNNGNVVPNKKNLKKVFKSHSSDALLEADDESTASSSVDTADGYQNGNCKETGKFSSDRHGPGLPGAVHQTTSFYNIHSCDNGCDEHSCCQDNNLTPALIDLENSPRHPKKPKSMELTAQYKKESNAEESCIIRIPPPPSATPNIPKDFASCLNTANKKRDSSKSNFRYSLNVELKTFTPDSSPYRSTTRAATTPGSISSIRSKSLDRESSRREAFTINPPISSTPFQSRGSIAGIYGSQYMKPPPRLCFYHFGSKEQGSVIEFKQSLCCWLLHL